MSDKYLLRNSQGQAMTVGGREVKLTKNEFDLISHYRRQVASMTANDLGFDAGITTITSIAKDISEQKFFEIGNLTDYIPFSIGGATAWAGNITTIRSFQFGQDFTDGIINVAESDAKLSAVTAGIDTVNQPVFNWAKKINFTLPELKQAAFLGSWDMQSAKIEALKTNWDLGIQKEIFLGSPVTGRGLLNLKGVKTDATILPKPFAAMDATEFNTWIGATPGAYRTNANYSAKPNRLIVPEADYLALGQYTSPNYPLRTKLEVLEDSFRKVFQNDFKVLPCAYANADQNGLGGSTNLYVLYNADIKTIRANVPVPFTALQYSTLNGFNFEMVGFGQFGSVSLLRPQEIYYMTCNA